MDSDLPHKITPEIANEAYKGLPAEIRSQEISFDIAQTKAEELAKLEIPENFSEDELYELLHQYACTSHDIGQAERTVRASVSAGAVEKTDIKEIRRAIENIRCLMRWSTNRLNVSLWAQIEFHTSVANCIAARIHYSYTDGIRKGDKALWKRDFGAQIEEAMKSIRKRSSVTSLSSGVTTPQEAEIGLSDKDCDTASSHTRDSCQVLSCATCQSEGVISDIISGRPR